MTIDLDESEVRRLVNDYIYFPGDNSNFVHLANYLVQEVCNQMGIDLEAEDK